MNHTQPNKKANLRINLDANCLVLRIKTDVVHI